MAVKEKIVITADNKTARAFREVQNSAKLTSAGLASMATKMAGVAAVGAAAAAGLFLLTKRAIESADAIAKTADAIGISTDALQDYRHAAELSGIATEKFDASLVAFSKRVGEAGAGTGSLVEFLNKYDKSLIPLITSTNNAGEALDAVFNIMGDMTSQTDRAAFAAAAFGRSGVVMTNMLRDGKVGLQEMREEAHRLGIVLDEDAVRGAEAANDAMLRMQKIVGVNLQRVLLELAPQITAFGEAFANAAPQISRMADEVIKFFFGVESLSLSGLRNELQELTDAENARALAVKKRGATHIGAIKGDIALIGVYEKEKAKLLELIAAGEKREKQLKKMFETGGADGAADDKTITTTVDNERKRAEALLAALDETHLQVMGRESELIDLRVERELEKLAEFHEAKTISEMEFLEAESDVYMTALERKRLLTEKNEAAITAMAKAEFDERAKAAQVLADAELRARRGLHDGLSAIAALQTVQSRKMFEVGKAAAASLALVKTYEGAQGVFASAAQVPYVGWILAPIAAAAAIVTGLANVKSIMSTSYGSTGGGGGGSSGGTPSIPSVPDVPTLAPPANDVGPTRILDVTLVGSAFTAESIRDDLIPLINEAAGDGVTINATVATG